MHPDLIVHDGLADFRILRPFELGPQDRASALSPRLAQQFVSRWLDDDPFGLASARDTLLCAARQLGPGVGLPPCNEEELARIVERAFRDGALVAVQVEVRELRGQVRKAEVVKEVVPEARPDRTIELHLVDHDTGEPLSGVRVRLKLPGKSDINYTTDAHGVVRVTGVEPGSWDVEQLEAHLEVVQVH